MFYFGLEIFTPKMKNKKITLQKQCELTIALPPFPKGGWTATEQSVVVVEGSFGCSLSSVG